MTSFSLRSAADLPIAEVADLLTRGFEGYFVPISIDEATLLTMVRRDSIDLNESRVLLNDGQPIGVALIARRGRASRLAAMGIAMDARQAGAGRWAMEGLLNEARARGDEQMVLEVIEQNIPGIRLYQRVGFKPIRRLVGYQLEKPPPGSTQGLEEMDIRELAELIAAHGLKDLPWQLSGESIIEYTAPARALRLKDAYGLITDPSAERVAIWSVLVKAAARGAGAGSGLLRAIFSNFPGKAWYVPAVYPEEMSAVFEGADMQRQAISQLQMVLKL